MRILIVSLCALVATSALGAVNHLSDGQLYMGEELLNEQPTGRMCNVAIDSVAAMDSKGRHCSRVQVKIHSADGRVPHEAFSLNSRITNYDTPSYRAGLRSCAMKLDGSIAGEEIFGEDSTSIYTPFFNGMIEIDDTEFHTFLTLSPRTKLPVRARVHLLSAIEESDIDCVNLRQM